MDCLDSPLGDTEVLAAFKSFKPNKALGPDGLHPLFFQNCWDILGLTTITFCRNTFKKAHIPKQSNKPLICLIPKTVDNSNLRNVRPIGLCNTTYKLVSKIIVNKIKPILHDIIGPCQASFLTNRRASYNVIIVQEFISHFNRMKGMKASMMLKINLEKAFDRIEWSYIREILLYFHFPKKLIELIMSCISSSTIEILVNGRKTNPFHPSRGIRQGDPMS